MKTLRQLLVVLGLLLAIVPTSVQAAEVWEINPATGGIGPAIPLTGIVYIDGGRLTVEVATGSNLTVDQVVVGLQEGTRVDAYASTAETGVIPVEYGDESCTGITLRPDIVGSGWIFLAAWGDGTFELSELKIHVTGNVSVRGRYNGIRMVPVNTWVSAVPSCVAQTKVTSFDVTGQWDGSTVVSWTGRSYVPRGTIVQIQWWSGSKWVSAGTVCDVSGEVVVPNSAGRIFRMWEIRIIRCVPIKWCTIAVGVSGVDPT